VAVLSAAGFGVQDQEDVMSSRTVLSQDLLERCAQRAGGYDRENRFSMEDFEEVRQTNYLLAAVTTGIRRAWIDARQGLPRAAPA
jgi:hypothetical protein